MDPADDEEEAWCAERREDVIEYLRGQEVAHRGVGEVPAWFVTPVLSIWAVESQQAPGWVGWWVICGDLPTDYCSADNCHHPRLAMRRIAEAWIAAIDRTPADASEIDDLGLSVDLSPDLRSRAEFMLTLSADDAQWLE